MLDEKGVMEKVKSSGVGEKSRTSFRQWSGGRKRRRRRSGGPGTNGYYCSVIMVGLVGLLCKRNEGGRADRDGFDRCLGMG